MKDLITSRQNPRVLAVCALADKKKRRQTRLFRLDGIKLLREACAARLAIESVFVRDPISPSIDALLREAIEDGVLREEAVSLVSESVFDKISEERSPEGVVTVAHCPDNLHLACDVASAIGQIGDGEKILLVESLRDPGNLGTVMRSCAALGIDRLILSDDCAELYNPKTVRSAMGALFRLPTVTVAGEELPILIRLLRQRGRRVFATALREDAERIGSLARSQGDCFVIGNEGHGLSGEAILACNDRVLIPMEQDCESLNAAIAASICMWELYKTDK